MALKISGVFKGKMAVEVTVIPQAIALVHGITKLMYPRHVMDEQTEFGAKGGSSLPLAISDKIHSHPSRVLNPRLYHHDSEITDWESPRMLLGVSPPINSRHDTIFRPRFK
jgi:hypothetical protein